jgi:hypothetical protein
MYVRCLNVLFLLKCLCFLISLLYYQSYLEVKERPRIDERSSIIADKFYINIDWIVL